MQYLLGHKRYLILGKNHAGFVLYKEETDDEEEAIIYFVLMRKSGCSRVARLDQLTGTMTERSTPMSNLPQQ